MTNASVNAAMRTAGVTSGPLMVTALGVSTHNVATAEDPYRALAQESTSWAGALATGTAAAQGGAWVGLAVAGPPGAVVGCIVGGLGGGAVGGLAGWEAGDNLYDMLGPDVPFALVQAETPESDQ